MSNLGWLEQVELRRVPAGVTGILILIISSTSSFVLNQSFFARTCSIAVATHKSSIFHVGVEELDLIVLPRFVLPQPGLGLESLVADPTLVRQHHLFFLLLLFFLCILFWVYVSHVSSPIPRVIESTETVFAWEVALGVGQIFSMWIS